MSCDAAAILLCCCERSERRWTQVDSGVSGTLLGDKFQGRHILSTRAARHAPFLPQTTLAPAPRCRNRKAKAELKAGALHEGRSISDKLSKSIHNHSSQLFSWVLLCAPAFHVRMLPCRARGKDLQASHNGLCASGPAWSRLKYYCMALWSAQRLSTTHVKGLAGTAPMG